MSGIHMVTGKPGAGKGLLFMNKINEIITGYDERMILTDFAVEKKPWVNGKGQPQIGYAAYLFRQYKRDYDMEERIFRINSDEIAKFYLYRPLPASITEFEGASLVPDDGSVMTREEFACHKKFRLWKANALTRTDKKTGDDIIIEFDFRLHESSGGLDIFCDEAWKHWGSRNWMATGEGVVFYAKQHRKVSDTVWIATQHEKDIDTIIVRVVQDFHKLRNRGKLKLGRFFRQPDDIRVTVTESPLTNDSQTKLEDYGFKKDITGLAQCYDTTSGVGLKGRSGGDIGDKPKGLDFRWMYLLGLIFPVVVYMGLAKLMKWAGFGQKNNNQNITTNAVPILKTNYQAQTSWGAQILPSFGVPTNYLTKANPLELLQGRQTYRQTQIQSEIEYYGGSPQDTNSVKCVGYTLLPDNDARVYFSDGTTAYSKVGEVQTITEHWVICFNRKFRVVAPRQINTVLSTAPLSQAPSSPQIIQETISQPDSVQVIYFPASRQDRQKPVARQGSAFGFKNVQTQLPSNE